MIMIFASVYIFSSLIACHEASTATETTASNSHARVVGGQAAAAGQWPWQVAIFKSRSHGPNYFTCGGILISSNWVLSAAHCFQESNITGLLLQFGVYDLAAPNANSQSRNTISFVNHPDYDPDTYFADISLVPFIESLSFNSYIQPIALPADSVTVIDGQRCIVSGFGETRGTGEALSVLRYATVEIISLPTCNAWYSDIRINVTDDHICAGYEEGQVDTCQGDSGGPLACHASVDSSLYVVQGITSFGYGCALSRRPGAYTSVLSYTDWIVGITGLKTGRGFPLITNTARTKYRHENRFCLFFLYIYGTWCLF